MADNNQDNTSVWGKWTEEEMAKMDKEPPYVKAIRHDQDGQWHKFGVLFDTQRWGWNYMIEWADYIASTDYEFVSQVWVDGEDATDQFEEAGKSFEKAFGEEEYGKLSFGGKSKTLDGPLKIIWFNQSNVIELQMLQNDGELVARYAETMIRELFGTDHAMLVYNKNVKVEDMY